MPGAAPDETASTSQSASAPSHASISAVGSPSRSSSSTPAGSVPCEAPRHLEPDGVVAAPGVADADDLQRRSTSSFRKCVAHEMHGS